MAPGEQPGRHISLLFQPYFGNNPQTTKIDGRWVRAAGLNLSLGMGSCYQQGKAQPRAVLPQSSVLLCPLPISCGEGKVQNSFCLDCSWVHAWGPGRARPISRAALLCTRAECQREPLWLWLDMRSLQQPDLPAGNRAPGTIP